MPDTPRPGGGREATYGAMAGRPDHEDFWKLSDIVVARDRTMDLTPVSMREAVLTETIARYIDPDVLRGFAEQRAFALLGIRLGGRVTPRVDEAARYGAIYIDAFVQGCEYYEVYGSHAKERSGEPGKREAMDEARIARHVDPESLRYLAQQRAYRVLRIETVADALRHGREVDRLRALYVGALIEGCEFKETYSPETGSGDEKTSDESPPENPSGL
jgi:hypothetical protein